MKSRPILFQGDMVRALLNGGKTQTRRAVKPQPTEAYWDECRRVMGGDMSKAFPVMDSVDGRNLLGLQRDKDDPGQATGFGNPNIKCPYGPVGSHLWVKESIRHIGDGGSEYVADGTFTVADAWPWKKDVLPSIFCPRGLSRITLEITEVRAQRLCDITEEDARAEGITDGGCLNCGQSEPCKCDKPKPCARDSFAYLWMRINGNNSWDLNPWIWAISFRRVTA